MPDDERVEHLLVAGQAVLLHVLEDAGGALDVTQQTEPERAREKASV